MGIKYCVIIPHSPILIPEIGQSNRSLLQKTLDSYQEIKQELKESGIKNIIILSPHGPIQDDSFICQSGIDMKLGGKEISYLGSRKKVSSNLSLSQLICEKIREEFQIRQTSSEMLDYGSSIPLELLMDEGFNPKVTAINKAEELSLEDHYNVGKKIAEAISENGFDCAIIASADLSHRLKKSSPGGYSPKGAKFDNKLIEYLNDSQSGPNQIITMDKNLVAAAKACGIKSIATALGTIHDREYEPEVLSYQTDLGIGYLSFVFRLKD